MSLTGFILSYAVNLVFWLWVVRWGGARWLEGTLTSGFLIHIFAPRWSAEGIRLFGWGAIVISTIILIAGLFWPDFRHFLG